MSAQRVRSDWEIYADTALEVGVLHKTLDRLAFLLELVEWVTARFFDSGVAVVGVAVGALET